MEPLPVRSNPIDAPEISFCFGPHTKIQLHKTIDADRPTLVKLKNTLQCIVVACPWHAHPGAVSGGEGGGPNVHCICVGPQKASQ